MGLDNPSSSKSGMRGAMPPQISDIGALSPLQDSTVVRKPADLTPITNGLNSLSDSIVQNMHRQQKEQADMNRQVDFTRLSTQTYTDAAAGYEDYKGKFNGPTDQFTQGYLKNYDQQVYDVKQGIKDPKLAAQYEEFALNHRAQLQLKGLTDQQNMFLQDYKTKYTDNKQSLSNLITANPTPETLAFAANSLKGQSEPLHAKLKAYGQDEAVKKELDADLNTLAKTMVMRQAASDPVAALKSLHDPDVNQYIPPDDQFTVEKYVNSVQDKKNTAFHQEATVTVDSLVAGLVSGKDTSALQQRIGELSQFGPDVMDMKLQRQVAVATASAPRYTSLSNSMVSMSKTQFEDALDSLDPQRDPSIKADTTLAERDAFHATAAAYLRKAYDDTHRNPIAATMAQTGADTATATQQYIQQRRQAGADLRDINILDQDTMQQHLGKINNAIATGNVDQAVSVLNDLRTTYQADDAHPGRWAAPGVDQMDLVLGQMSRDSQHPLDSKLIAAYHLLPKDQPIDAHNSLLIQSAMMKDDQKKQLLATSGLTTDGKGGDALDALNRHLMETNPTWKAYFHPDKPTGQFSALLMQQQDLLLKTMLLNISSGRYKPTGGYEIGPGALIPGLPSFSVGQKSGTDNAEAAIIKNYLPFQTIGGKSTDRPWQWQDSLNFNDQKPRGPLMNIEMRDVMVPQKLAGQITQDGISNYVSTQLKNKDWVFNNVHINGVNNAPSTQVAGKWPVDDAFKQQVNGIATRLQADPNDLMGVMKTESGFNAGAKNPTSTATGLIQWMTPPNGMSRDQWAAQPASAQLQYVEKWMSPYQGKLNSPGRVYLAVAAPGILGKLPKDAGPDTVIYAAGSKEAKANAGWQDAHGNVTLGKLDQLVSNAKQQAGVPASPQTYAQLPKGHQQLVDKAMAVTNQNIVLKRTEDAGGVRVYGVQNGQEVPLMGKDGRPLEMRWDQIQKANPRKLASK